MFGLGPAELIIIAVIVLLIFGGKRIPEIGKGIGGAIRELRNVRKEMNPAGDNAGEDALDSPTFESKVADRVMEHVPVVKDAVAVKKKADQIKKILS